MHSRPFVRILLDSELVSQLLLRPHQPYPYPDQVHLPPQLFNFSPNSLPPKRFSSSLAPAPFPCSFSSLHSLPMGEKESGSQLSLEAANDSLPSTADKETILPCDSAEPPEIKRRQAGGNWFRLPGGCLLALHRGDITEWSVDGKTDAIVNAANRGLLGGGGVDGAIHRAAGPKLYEACQKLPCISGHIRCQTGDAVITSGFQLPVSKIIHAVGPVYEDKETSAPLLESAYKNAITMAVQNNIKYLSFPAISCGVYGYPHDEAAEIALTTVQENAQHLLEEVHFVLFERGPWLKWLSRADQKFEKLSYDQ